MDVSEILKPHPTTSPVGQLAETTGEHVRVPVLRRRGQRVARFGGLNRAVNSSYGGHASYAEERVLCRMVFQPVGTSLGRSLAPK